MSLNPAFDSSQMRFQIMKGIEIQQLLERENIELRKENQDLKNTIELNQSMKSLFDQQGIATFIEGYKKLKESFLTIKLELKSMSHDYSNYQKSTIRDYNNLKSQFTILFKFNKLMEKEKLDKCNEIIKLQKTLDKATSSQKNDTSTKVQLIEKLTKDNTKWELKYHLLQKEYNELEVKFQDMKSVRDELNKKYTELTTKHENEKGENRSLRQQLALSEMNLKESDSIHTEQIQQLKDSHAKDLAHLRENINKLTIKLTASQEEIDRLSGMMVGNKSHFAKYVELKTENTALLAKIKCYEESSNALNLPAGTPRALIRSIRQPHSAGSAGSSSGTSGCSGSGGNNNNSIRLASATK